MKMLVAVLAAATLLAGCQSTTGSSTPPRQAIGRGETMSTAIPIRTRSDTEGSKMIKDWVRANYPGYAIQHQEVIEEYGRAFVMTTIMSPGNSQRNVYFDISMYHRSIGNPSYPKPTG